MFRADLEHTGNSLHRRAVFISGVQFSDSPGGNNDGNIAPGENIQLTISLYNQRSSTVTNLNTRLYSLTPGVTVLQATSPYIFHEPPGIATNRSPFEIHVGKSIACGSRL